MKIHARDIRVELMDKSNSLFEAWLRDSDSPFADQYYYTIITVTSKDESIIRYVSEYFDGVGIRVEDEEVEKGIKRALDMWLKRHELAAA